MNVYRWEDSARVVEIMAKSLVDARFKAMSHLVMTNLPAVALTRDNEPDSIRQCSKAAIGEDCVKTWKKH